MDLMSRRRILLAQSAQSGVLATATGNPMTFTTDLVRRLHSLVIPFTPIQAAGTPTPDNPLPISGWTGANVYNETAYNASATPKLTISWQTSAGTIYGGTVTLNEDGSADVVATMAEVDLGTFDWTLTSSGRHSMSKPDNAKVVQNTETMYAFCSEYTVIRGDAIANRDMSIGMVNLQRIQINDSNLNGISAEDFKTAMSGVKLVYELTTPLAPVHIPNVGSLYTYLGTNTIWTDTNGTNTAEYWIKNS